MIIYARSKQFLPSSTYSHSMPHFFFMQAFPINCFLSQDANWITEAIPLEKLRFFCMRKQDFVFYPSPFNQSCLQPGQPDNCTTASKGMAKDDKKQPGRPTWKKELLELFLFFFLPEPSQLSTHYFTQFVPMSRVVGRIQANACIP